MSPERNVADYEVRVEGKLDSVTESVLKTAGWQESVGCFGKATTAKTTI